MLKFSVSLLVKIVAFFGTLHWPAKSGDLGGGGVSLVELLILYELSAGEQLVLEKAVPRRRRVDDKCQCRLFLVVQAETFGVRVASWVICSLSLSFEFWYTLNILCLLQNE